MRKHCYRIEVFSTKTSCSQYDLKLLCKVCVTKLVVQMSQLLPLLNVWSLHLQTLMTQGLTHVAFPVRSGTEHMIAHLVFYTPSHKVRQDRSVLYSDFQCAIVRDVSLRERRHDQLSSVFPLRFRSRHNHKRYRICLRVGPDPVPS